MSNNKIVRLAQSWLLFWFLIAFDQWTKHLAVTRLKGNAAYPLWDGVFEFAYSENRGAAFGLLQGQQFLFLAVSVVVFAAVLYLLWQLPAEKHYLPLILCLIVIAAGAAGNLIDRVKQGYVVDFLYFKLIDFPIFNVADCYVTCATAALVLLLFSGYYKEEELLGVLPGRKESA